MTDVEINNTALMCVRKIDQEFTDKVIYLVTKELAKIIPNTYLVQYSKEIIAGITLMLTNSQYNCFMAKWAVLSDMDRIDLIT